MYDVVDDVVSMLNSGWSAGIEKPKITALWNTRSTDLANEDIILVYPSNETDTFFNLGATSLRKDVYVTIDIRTGVSKSRAFEMMEECERIVRANVTKTGYVLVKPIRKTELSSDLRKVWRILMELVLILVA